VFSSITLWIEVRPPILTHAPHFLGSDWSTVTVEWWDCLVIRVADHVGCVNDRCLSAPPRGGSHA